MDILLHLVACFAALTLIAAALVYPFNPEVAQKLLKRLLLSLLGVLAGLDLVCQLWHQLGAFCAAVLLSLVSVAAYWVREYRMRPPSRPRSPAGRNARPFYQAGGNNALAGLDQFFGARVEKETERYLGQLALLPTLASQKNLAELLQGFASAPGPHVTLGRTPWGQPVVVPLDELTRAFGLVTGGTGSGKSMFALLILKALIEKAPDARPIGFGVIDPKGDLFQGALFLLHEALRALFQLWCDDEIAEP